MKKFLVAIICLALLFTLAACGGGGSAPGRTRDRDRDDDDRDRAPSQSTENLAETVWTGVVFSDEVLELAFNNDSSYYFLHYKPDDDSHFFVTTGTYRTEGSALFLNREYYVRVYASDDGGEEISVSEVSVTEEAVLAGNKIILNEDYEDYRFELTAGKASGKWSFERSEALMTDHAESADEYAGEGEDDEPEYRDLGGRTITIGTWWNPEALSSERQAHVDELQARHNFTIREERIGDWGQMLDLLAVSVIAGAPEATVFTLSSDVLLHAMRQNLLYDLGVLQPSYIYSFAWDMRLTDGLTFNGETYALAPFTSIDTALGVFFNKDILADAGIDPFTPYNMLSSGTWTWDSFLDLLSAVSGSYNGVTALGDDAVAAAVFSNGAEFVGKDASGSFYNAANSSAFLEAVSFIEHIGNSGYFVREPAGSMWGWWHDEFAGGNTAFCIAPEWSTDFFSRFAAFDWGFVPFPRGSQSDIVTSPYHQNVLTIPNTFSHAEVEDIVFALGLFYNFNDDPWIPLNPVLRLEHYIPEYRINFTDGWWEEQTAAQIVEWSQAEWNTVIAGANSAIFG
jgi:ABC-type glycerol-3-phosphate transport system substrate-binding protein